MKEQIVGIDIGKEDDATVVVIVASGYRPSGEPMIWVNTRGKDVLLEEVIKNAERKKKKKG